MIKIKVDSINLPSVNLIRYIPRYVPSKTMKPYYPRRFKNRWLCDECTEFLNRYHVYRAHARPESEMAIEPTYKLHETPEECELSVLTRMWEIKEMTKQKHNFSFDDNLLEGITLSGERWRGKHLIGPVYDYL